MSSKNLREETEGLIYKYEDMAQKPPLYWKPLTKEILSRLKSQIEQMENPYSPKLDIPRCIGWDRARQDILNKL